MTRLNREEMHDNAQLSDIQATATDSDKMVKKTKSFEYLLSSLLNKTYCIVSLQNLVFTTF